MLDLNIDSLQLNIADAAGHEYRIESIATRAVTLLAERLDAPDMSGSGRAMDSLDAPAVSVNLNAMSDEQAAQAIASAWLDALMLKLRL